MSARWLARAAFLLVLAAVADIEAGHIQGTCAREITSSGTAERKSSSSSRFANEAPVARDQRLRSVDYG
jgi:hypothetical protein